MYKTNYGNRNVPSAPPAGRILSGRALRRALGGIILTLALACCLRAQAQRTATAVVTLTNGSVASITVSDGGSGYVLVPTVTLVGGGGTGAIAAALVTDGAVSQIIILTVGGGFTTAPAVVIDPPPPTIIPAALSNSRVPALFVSGPAGQTQEVQYADALGSSNTWFTLTNIVLGAAVVVLMLGALDGVRAGPSAMGLDTTRHFHDGQPAHGARPLDERESADGGDVESGVLDGTI